MNIETLMEKVDHLIIGGGMMFTFAKALGGHVGSSMVEEDKLDMALNIIEIAKKNNVKIHLPVDTIAADKFEFEQCVVFCENNYCIIERNTGQGRDPTNRQSEIKIGRHAFLPVEADRDTVRCPLARQQRQAKQPGQMQPAG